jgi:hypothetical protein
MNGCPKKLVEGGYNIEGTEKRKNGKYGESSKQCNRGAWISH